VTARASTVLLGLQFAVQPINLLHALAAWNDATHYESGELLHRIERPCEAFQRPA
jgi:hypothetical protein